MTSSPSQPVLPLVWPIVHKNRFAFYLTNIAAFRNYAKLFQNFFRRCSRLNVPSLLRFMSSDGG